MEQTDAAFLIINFTISAHTDIFFLFYTKVVIRLKLLRIHIPGEVTALIRS